MPPNPMDNAPTPPLMNDQMLSGLPLMEHAGGVSHQYANIHPDTPVASPTLPTATESYKVSMTPQQRFKQER